ncbi:PAS domain-containing sensor histidine kinase [Pseudolabrys sp. Root1462]|uniref:sensor histidine kinase n=1 Tax=Pseudolabrys sp. Root1462 TaxID=1736466 RepID=UPI000A3F2A1D|nr:PAS domain-containing sensor histidine kinase [Pseudolabrys sp. Root1462]
MMDAVAHTQLIEQGRPVSESLYELEAELIDQLVGQWYVELPRQRGSIEDLLVSTRLTDLNGEARRLLQASSADELAGASLARFVATSSRPAMAELLEKARVGSTEVTNLCLLTTEGAPVGIRLLAARTGEGDDRLVLVGSESPLPDATVDELIKNEERYRRLFQRMPIALWRVDPRGVKSLLGDARDAGVTDLVAHFNRHPELFELAMDSITIAEVNELTVQLFGGTSSVDFIRPIRSYWKARPDTLRRVIGARYRGLPQYTEETQVCGIDGRVVDVVMSMAFPPPDDIDGDCLVGMIDITNRRQAEVQLRELQDEFARAARISMLSELTASIAHELRQPLAAITTHGDAAMRWLAATPPVVDRAVKGLEGMVKAADRASAIIQRIHRMAINEAAQCTSVDINAAIADIAIFVKHDLQSRQVELVLNLEDGLPAVFGDEVQLQQVMHNLVRNSAQAIADGQCPLRCITVSTARRGDHIEIVVEDTGPGIPPEQIDRLFTAFETTKAGGMGIGLTLCRSIVISHGGTIEPDVSVCDGARFRITLPVQVDP